MRELLEPDGCLCHRVLNRRVLRLVYRLAVAAGIVACIVGARAAAQAPAGAAPKPAPQAAPARPRAGAPAANLQQLMRGIMYPASNVVFAAQEDVTQFKPADNASTSPNPLTSTYGGWQAVENAGLALVETAGLVSVPGRSCANGKPVPVQRADWVKYTEGLREAGRAVYKAAQAKDQDAMLEAAGVVSEACTACHDVYREKKNLNDRCLP